MTSQGQTILVFVGITGLIIPLLILVIAPIALVIAVAHVLNKLSTDSEIIVMNASGMSPWVLFRGFITVAIVVAIGVTAISAYFAPKGLRMLRDWLTEVSANVVSTIVQPGRFTTIQSGRHDPYPRTPRQRSVARHLSRRPARPGRARHRIGGDRRTGRQRHRHLPHSAEGHRAAPPGRPARSGDGGVRPLCLRSLAVRRRVNRAIKYSIRERYFWQLLFPDPKDPLYVEQPGQFRAELHDRLVAPLYPIAFAIIAFAYLGAPRTNRQSRTLSMMGAIGGVALLRLIGFVCTVFGATMPWLLPVQYVAIAASLRRRTVRDPPRPDPGAARLHHQWARRAHRAHRPTVRDVMS